MKLAKRALRWATRKLDRIAEKIIRAYYTACLFFALSTLIIYQAWNGL